MLVSLVFAVEVAVSCRQPLVGFWFVGPTWGLRRFYPEGKEVPLAVSLAAVTETPKSQLPRFALASILSFPVLFRNSVLRSLSLSKGRRLP